MSGVYFVEGTTVLLPGDRSIASGYNKAAADRFAAELNRLHAARYGSPEGWPEGADAEGAELVPACNLYDDINVWQRWSSLGGWEDLNYDVWKYVPGDVVVVARRKPKPVTRDVLAWDLEPGMRVALAETNVIEADRVVRLRDGVDVHTPSGSVLSVDRNQTFAVLVEEPNG